jgi:hypothetical protein
MARPHDVQKSDTVPPSLTIWTAQPRSTSLDDIKAEASCANSHHNPGDNRKIAVGRHCCRGKIKAGADHIANHGGRARCNAEAFASGVVGLRPARSPLSV